MTDTKVITGEVRFSYANVFTPKPRFEGGDDVYSVTLIIPKDDKKTLKKIKAAQQAALEAAKDTKLKGKLPKLWSSTLRDGDNFGTNEAGDKQNTDERPEYFGCYFINVWNKRRPGIVDQDRQPILDSDEFYSGCYGVASISAWAYNAKGKIGVSFNLNNLMKLRDGEPLGASISDPEDDFAEI